ncbi:MAG: topoisomerase 1 [Planctomycetota bacterium]|jgi:DNA topoisomerase-1
MPAKTSKSSTGKASGSQLVIVESPAKAKTIAKYLGSGFVVEASKGHIRDLPKRAPKGVKQPVPGVDLDNDFEPSYEVSDDRKSQVTALKKLAKGASEIWFATDLDREGEAIAWHLAELLGVDPATAKRVEFDEITRSAIVKAFEQPRPIAIDRVNAQQARRILDRIVGYEVSPVLWKKVAGGLSAGRVQSVALKLIVDREREIRAFQPDERWKVEAAMTPDPSKGAALAREWSDFMSRVDDRGKGPTVKEQSHWLADRLGIECELVQVGGVPLELGREVPKYEDHPEFGKARPSITIPDWVLRKVEEDRKSKTPIPQEPGWYDAGEALVQRVQAVAEAVGLEGVTVELLPPETIDLRKEAEPVGFARWQRRVRGTIGAGVRYRVKSVERTGTSSRPRAPFITSTLQSSASYALGFGTDRTMRVAQMLYQGVNVPGEGLVGLITYMRTDSTNLSGEALGAVREFIGKEFGPDFLPDKPRFYGSSNKSAQEAHEAIRPTNVRRTPASLRGKIDEEMWKLYNLIWQRFVACQMTDALYDSTSVLLERSDRPTGAVFRASGRVQTFPGYTVTGIRGEGEDQELPALREGQEMAPFWLEPQQKFTSPPGRFNEASLVRELEKQGIGRPSTYASIINTIEERKYVEQVSRAFHATDIGMAVCRFLEEPFKDGFMDVGYTRRIEEQFDEIAQGKLPWRTMLRAFYAPFRSVVAGLMQREHVKAASTPSPYACPVCGRRCEYRLGKTGRFLSCTGFAEKVEVQQPPTKSGKKRKPKFEPACSYAAPVNRQGRPLLPEKVDIKCPVDGAPMILRTGRFGDFLTSIHRETQFVLNIDRKGGIKFPSPPPFVTDLPCPKCGASMNLRSGKRGPWLGCSKFPKCRGRESWARIEPGRQQELEKALAMHEAAQPTFEITSLDGTPLQEGTPVAALLIPGEEAELKLHPDYERERSRQAS